MEREDITRVEPSEDAPLMQLVAEMREARAMFVEQLCSWPGEELLPFSGITRFFYHPKE